MIERQQDLGRPDQRAPMTEVSQRLGYPLDRDEDPSRKEVRGFYVPSDDYDREDPRLSQGVEYYPLIELPSIRPYASGETDPIASNNNLIGRQVSGTLYESIE
jgi:hypothetical protein